MVENEDLMQCLIYYGRRMPQDFVMRSRDIRDIIYYLRAERDFEILKLTSFVTTNLVSFEKTDVSRFGTHPSPADESKVEAFRLDHHE